MSKPRGDVDRSSRRRDHPHDESVNKHHVLSRSAPSATSGIATAVVAKEEDLFFLCRSDGSLPLRGNHGYGLYFHDCRFLDGYTLEVAGGSMISLIASAAEGFMMRLELTNPELEIGSDRVRPHTFGCRWERVLCGETRTLSERLTFHNFGGDALELPLTFRFAARFEDVFCVRGLADGTRGKLHPPAWDEDRLVFVYEGSDDVRRCVAISFSGPPRSRDEAGASFSLTIGPKGDATIGVRIALREDEPDDKASTGTNTGASKRDVDAVRRSLAESNAEWQRSRTRVTTDSIALNRLIERSVGDLHTLRSRREPGEFFAAGLPWFGTVFGRDTIIAALEMLAFRTSTARETLRVLAHYQGTRDDAWRDEQPGRILHELRVGELARCGAIPHTPYYGTVDATQLFVILLARYVAWTGDLKLFRELRDNVIAALDWMTDAGDANRDGYIEYESKSKGGLANQGWKDSGDAIVDEDGTIANPPISLVEVQAYAYRAMTSAADLFALTEEADRARDLRSAADALRTRFNRDFWLDDLDCYALGLERGGRPLRVVTSNAGHALWAGIAEPEHADRLAARLMEPDMFAGWGIRTLSAQARAYNPVGYHLGTIWPHDNALIAAGLHGYGHDEAMSKILHGIVRAAMTFDHYRLPEVFAGFSSEDYDTPVRYPVACHPQAWAAGSSLLLVETMLGLDPDAIRHRLSIVRPVLPSFVDRLALEGLRVGDAEADITFTRRDDQPLAVEVTRCDGTLDVAVVREPG